MQDGHVPSIYEGGSCNYVRVARARCLVCEETCTTNFRALGAPYHGLVHERCAPLFEYNGIYPHPLPLSQYCAATTVRNRRNSSPDFMRLELRRSSG